MTNPPTNEHAQPPEKEAPKTKPNLLGLAATMASSIALILTLLGCGVSYSVESTFGLPHASVFESALDLTDLSGYSIAQLLNHGYSMLFDWSLYSSMYARSWPMILIGVSCALLLAAIAWWWGHRPQRPTSKKPKKIAAPVHKPATEMHRFAVALAACFPLMPIIAAAMIAVVCALCVLVAFAPMIGMVTGDSYIKEWVIEPEICVPLLSREKRLQTSSPKDGSTKHPKASACVVVSKDNVEIARGRVILMTTKSAALFNPTTGAVRRVPIDTNVVEIVSSLDAPKATAAAASASSSSSGGTAETILAPGTGGHMIHANGPSPQQSL